MGHDGFFRRGRHQQIGFDQHAQAGLNPLGSHAVEHLIDQRTDRGRFVGGVTDENLGHDGPIGGLFDGWQDLFQQPAGTTDLQTSARLVEHR